MRYTIRGDDNVALAFCENDRVKSILQNIHLILTTRKGTIPMYREFGLDMDFVDKPIPVAETLMASRVKTALDEFEPRAEFVDIDFEHSKDAFGAMIPILEVEIEDE